MLRIAASLLLCVAAGAALAQAQQPGVIVGGSTAGTGGVSVGGLPAARAGDLTQNGGHVEEGSSNVTINGRPAARVGDKTGCGVVVKGSSNVYINGRPMARTGDATSGC